MATDETNDIKALFAEIRTDEQAARVRDYGEVDAATYDQRVKDGAATVQHLELAFLAITPEVLDMATSEVEKTWETPGDELGAILRGERLGVEYDKFRAEATEKALSRMQGEVGGRER